jgi:hypothetical protein
MATIGSPAALATTSWLAARGEDIIDAGRGDDVIFWDPDDAEVAGGVGNDTLRVRDDDLDLSAFGGTLEGIEVVDMSKGGPSTTALTASDLLDLSDTGELMVLGDSDDSLDAGAVWNDAGIDAEGLQLLTQDVGGTMATLLIDLDMQVNPDVVA